MALIAKVELTLNLSEDPEYPFALAEEAGLDLVDAEGEDRIAILHDAVYHALEHNAEDFLKEFDGDVMPVQVRIIEE